MSTEKEALRQSLKAQRDRLALDGSAVSRTVADRFPAKLLDRFGPRVSGYAPIGSELDVRPLLQRLQALGAHLALPRVEDSGHISFRAWQFGDELVDGPMRLKQPSSDADIVQPTLVLLPLLAFDGFGNRLGYGKGYYDRALTRLRETGRAFACGIAYSGQEVERVPDEPHDVPLDWVVTEKGSHPLFLQRAASPA